MRYCLQPSLKGLFHLLVFALLVTAALLSLGRNVAAYQRDHLTEQEADLVREAQALDRRIEIFIKAVDRRLLALSDGNATQSKQVKKDMEKWGELPTGTRTQLLSDIARILDEAITNIDDAGARSSQSIILPKAFQKLTEASTRILPQLTAMRSTTNDKAEREMLEQAIENLQSIAAAANRTGKPQG